MGPLQFASAIKAIIKRAKDRGVKPKAFQKMIAIFDLKKMLKGQGK